MKQTDQELWAVAAEYYKLKSEGKNPIAQYYYPDHNKWYEHEDHHGFNMPDFDSGDIWRIKPETIQHRGGEYPKPCTDVDELLKAGLAYRPAFKFGDSGSMVAVAMALNTNSHRVSAMAKSGLYYLKPEDAIARARVIYEID